MVHIDVFVENEVVVSHIGDSLRAQQLDILIGGGLQVIKVPQRIWSFTARWCHLGQEQFRGTFFWWVIVGEVQLRPPVKRAGPHRNRRLDTCQLNRKWSFQTISRRAAAPRHTLKVEKLNIFVCKLWFFYVYFYRVSLLSSERRFLLTVIVVPVEADVAGHGGWSGGHRVYGGCSWWRSVGQVGSGGRGGEPDVRSIHAAARKIF